MRKMLLLGAAIVVLLAGIGARAEEPGMPSCSKVEELVTRIDTDLSSGFAHGDQALPVGQAYSAGTKITTEQAETLYNGTTNLDTGLEKVLENVSSLDKLFPAGRDIKLQMIHLKLGTYAEPILKFRRLAIQRLMSATLCDPFAEGAIDCQAKPLAPLYLSEKDGQKIEAYSSLRSGLTKGLPDLKAFLMDRCQKDAKASESDCPTCGR